MLARLLRFSYLVQVLTGALIGSWGAVELAPQWGVAALGLVVLGGLGWVVFWQAVVIGGSMLVSRPSGPLGPWLNAVAGEFWAALLIFGLRMPWTRSNPGILPPVSAPEPGKTTQPVLLVHGFLCNHRVWDSVAPALRQAGHTVLAVDLEPVFTSIDDFVPLIERAVASLRRQTGTDKVVLVGHSMGGLAIRAWLHAHGTAHVEKIITLGTPHHGTQAPQWLSAPNGEQMKWHSRWTEELARNETPQQRQLMQLALTQHDNIVYPQRQQMLDGSTVTEFNGIGHLQMCLNKTVISWLLRQTDTPDARPQPT
jgi:triacylglycerol esterase/lipase EstA (alpha/beta hydrolase family)